MSNSPQFIRTDKAIIQALVQLLKHKPFEQITVQNILDETPVTRATFYAHFHDKYEIAERMLAIFLERKDALLVKLNHEKKSNFYQHIMENCQDIGEIVDALMKIHTEKVDLYSIMLQSYHEEYMQLQADNTKDAPTGAQLEAEASLYAHMMISIQTSYLNYPTELVSKDYKLDDILLRPFLTILRLNNDKQLIEIIYKHIERENAKREKELESML